MFIPKEGKFRPGGLPAGLRSCSSPIMMGLKDWSSSSPELLLRSVWGV